MGNYLVYHAPEELESAAGKMKVPYHLGVDSELSLTDLISAYRKGLYSLQRRIETTCIAYAYIMTKGTNPRIRGTTIGDVIVYSDKNESYLVTSKGLVNITAI